MPVEAPRKADQLPHPVEDELLELGGGGRRPPEHRVDVQRGDQELRQDPRLGARDREVGEEARVVPVRDAREEHLVEIAQDGGERLGLPGRCGRKP